MQLRYYQSEAVIAVWDFLKSQAGNPLVVLPTGAGKSLVIAEMARAAVHDYAGRVIILQHRKELIEQNADKLRRLGVPVGIYSAGLNRKQINEDVILAGIQSCYKKALDFGRRHLVIIDEAHLVADEGMFNSFLLDLSSVNPRLRVVGLTATPYRTGEGHLTDGGLWTKGVYEVKVSQLIRDGFLSPLTNKPAELHYATETLRVRGGEYQEADLQRVFGDAQKIEAAVNEIKVATRDRRSVLVFCSGVNHAHEVAEMLDGEVVHGGTLAIERAGILESFARGEIKYLCNCDVLTTGFDAPNIDSVVLLRATLSPGLFVQMAGRGFRLAPGKDNCLILDFGGNISRHGPLDAVDFGTRKSAAIEGEAEPAEKTCPGCDTQIAAGKRVCACGFEFPKPELKHDIEADSSSQVLAEPETFAVSGWMFSRHEKKEPNSLRVTYFLEGDLGHAIEEWVCLEHEGYAGSKALRWWSEHSSDDLDNTRELIEDQYGDPVDRIEAAIILERDKQVQCPIKITAIREGRWWRVLDREFGERQEVEEDIPF